VVEIVHFEHLLYRLLAKLDLSNSKVSFCPYLIYCAKFIYTTVNVCVCVCAGGGGSKVRRLESRQIKDYFGCVGTSGGGVGHTPSSPPTASIGVQTEVTVRRLAEMEGQSQTSSQVSALQSRVTELEHFITLSTEKLESTTARLNKCLSVGKQLLIEKVNEYY
jgi:hypothetical protein